jgi:glycosyltransferase involved in cell wall biosynthesis
MELIREPVIEVTNTASHKFHTGIERVARTTIPLWLADHAAQLAVFDSATKTLRPLGPVESNRVLRWGEATPVASAAAKPDRILVPWRTTVVLPELAGMPERAARLAAVAACSGNDLSAIVFDLIPYSLPDSVAGDLPRRFGNYMSAIRRGARLSAISQSVADDFSGFSAAFTNQGVATPQIHADLLPFEAGQVNEQSLEAHRDEVLGDSRLPLVLSVSSIEPRKNHLRTLQAAERLWREGLEFQLLFIAGRGWKREAFDTEFAGLAARGRPVRLISSASEELLWSAYHLAAFSVFISTAEGFGLPAAESIAAGTPVVLSRNGSMGEIGAGGGAIMVDPHDVDDITSAMRCLLTDDARLRTLADQARARVLPTWSDYADKTWRWLADGDR